MKKRLLTAKSNRQFAILPSFGIVRFVGDYKFRIAFIWGCWQMSIGCFRHCGADVREE